MRGMLDTVWLILSAMIFGGSNGISRFAKTNYTSDNKICEKYRKPCRFNGWNLYIFQYHGIRSIYFNCCAGSGCSEKRIEEKGLKPELLSRTLEDSGTMTSVLIPWNTCGATQSRVLGVPTLDYLPYAFFNIISPLMTILFAYLNIKIRRLDKDPDKNEKAIEVK